MALADRMKQYEASYEYTLAADLPIILRLDGHGFSKFTASFARPFDQRIHNSMIATCSDLLLYFPQATIAYTQSDEITLVFPHGVKSFNDRVQKLASLAASYCSVRFGAHLTSQLSANPEPQVKENASEKIKFAHFDARLFSLPSVEEALNCLLWRCKGDAIRNAVSSFARTLFSQQEMERKSTKELMEMMKNEKGVKFEDSVPIWAVEGCLMKREQVEHEGINLKTGKLETALRTKTRVEYRGMREFSDSNLRLVTDKFW